MGAPLAVGQGDTVGVGDGRAEGTGVGGWLGCGVGHGTGTGDGGGVTHELAVVDVGRAEVDDEIEQKEDCRVRAFADATHSAA